MLKLTFTLALHILTARRLTVVMIIITMTVIIIPIIIIMIIKIIIINSHCLEMITNHLIAV